MRRGVRPSQDPACYLTTWPHLPLAPCSQAGGTEGVSNTPCSCQQVWDLPRVNFLSLPSEETPLLALPSGPPAPPGKGLILQKEKGSLEGVGPEMKEQDLEWEQRLEETSPRPADETQLLTARVRCLC